MMDLTRKVREQTFGMLLRWMLATNVPIGLAASTGELVPSGRYLVVVVDIPIARVVLGGSCITPSSTCLGSSTERRRTLVEIQAS